MNDRELLEAAVQRVRSGGVTTAPGILEELHNKSAEWAAVTICQVRRISTACKKLEPQLDSDARGKAAKRKEERRQQQQTRRCEEREVASTAEEERRRKLQRLHDEASAARARQAAIQQEHAAARDVPRRLRECAAGQVKDLIQRALQSYDPAAQLDATSRAHRTDEMSCLVPHENSTFCCPNTGKQLKADTLKLMHKRRCIEWSPSLDRAMHLICTPCVDCFSRREEHTPVALCPAR